MEPLIELCDQCKRELERRAKDQDAQGYFLCEGCLRVFPTAFGVGQVLCNECKKELTQ